MTLKDRIGEDMKSALKARDTQRLSAIRLLMAAIKQKEVDERVSLDDAAVLGVIDKLLKQRRDAITQFEAAGRLDLVQKENAEVDVLRAYLPEGLDASEIDAAIDAALAEVAAAGASGPAAMGRAMGLLKPRLSGRADMTAVAARVKERLAG